MTGCCTANFNQGWPKFAHALVYGLPGGGVAVGAYAPVRVDLPGGSTVEVDTAYPFGDDATVTVTNNGATHLPVHLRIPGWATAATVDGQPAANGTMWTGVAPAGKGTAFRVAFNPAIRVERWFNGAVSVHRGALMYSLPIDANYTVYARHYGSANMSSDYYLEPTSSWRFAIDVDPGDPARTLTWRTNGGGGGGGGGAPFNHTGWPVVIEATVRALPSWGTAKNSAAAPPASPACTAARGACGLPQKVLLVPHGGTDLRIGELPMSGLT